MEDIVVKMPEEGWTRENVLSELGYGARSDKSKYMLWVCWSAIGDTAVLKVNPENEQQRLLVIPDKIYWELYYKYYGWWKQIPTKLEKYNLKLKIVYNESWYQSIGTGFDKVREAQAALDKAIKAYQEKKIHADFRLEKRGVYCIKDKDEIIYIGSTVRSFGERWEEHRKIFEGELDKPNMKLYSAKNWKDFSYEIIFDMDEVLWGIEGDWPREMLK